VSQRRLTLITIGVMLSLFISSVEGTIVATAMPTIVSDLGGLAYYSWVFSAYMLASTTTVPIYGKLSDIYGRRPVFAVAMALFLIGSLLCGRAGSMGALIAARTVQGLGAGGLLPLAFTIIGDLFTFEQRARLQGLFSSVWGFSSIIGPLLGGFLVDRVSWPWVFYFNLVPGLLAFGFVWFSWRDPAHAPRKAGVRVDYAGAALLSAGVVALLLGLFTVGTPEGWALLVVAAILLGALLWVEARAADPILPLPLFRDRLFAVACGQGALAGCAMFGIASYIPLFVQGVLGTSATVAGATLTPESLAWVVMSLFSSRLLLITSARSVALGGMFLLAGGAAALLTVGQTTPLILLILYLAIMGAGMGLAFPAFMIAVQNTVPRRALGSATSTLQFSRSIGGTFGVSIMGAALSASLASNLLNAGLDANSVSLNDLLDPLANASAALEGAVRAALAGATHVAFVIALLAALAGLAFTFLAPRDRVPRSTAPVLEA
jgi:EmrB/QacA subfamily drug resistance transporter